MKTNSEYTSEPTVEEEDAKENLERLKAIRATHRGVITTKVQQAIEILGDEGDTLTDEDFQQLDMIKRLLDGKLILRKLEEIDQNVLPLCTLENIEHEIEESNKVFKRKWWNVRGKYKMRYRNTTRR